MIIVDRELVEFSGKGDRMKANIRGLLFMIDRKPREMMQGCERYSICLV